MVQGKVYGADFRIQKPLCAGGMGKVFVAEQLSTGKRRALKLMAPELVTDPRMRDHFALEAHAAAMVESEHVVEVVASGVDAGQPWLAMELLDGEDLAARVAGRGGLPVTEVAAIVAQLCHGLGAAHDRGLVHRDLKPENVFVARSRREGAPFTVKLLDFGIAKVAASKTVTGSIGTPLWMAPEQATGEKATPAADVWALGLLVYFALTGRSYWNGANENASISTLLVEIMVGPLVPATVRAAEQGRAGALPPGFDGWFAACVAREPERRFRDAHVAAAAFADLLARGTLRGFRPPKRPTLRHRGLSARFLVVASVLFLGSLLFAGGFVGSALLSSVTEPGYLGQSGR